MLCLIISPSGAFKDLKGEQKEKLSQRKCKLNRFFIAFHIKAKRLTVKSFYDRLASLFAHKMILLRKLSLKHRSVSVGCQMPKQLFRSHSRREQLTFQAFIFPPRKQLKRENRIRTAESEFPRNFHCNNFLSPTKFTSIAFTFPTHDIAELPSCFSFSN